MFNFISQKENRRYVHMWRHNQEANERFCVKVSTLIAR